MSQETLDKIEKLEKAINSPATPEAIKVDLQKTLDLLKGMDNSNSTETSLTVVASASPIKSCLLEDGDDENDFIYEGKRFHNIENPSSKDTWEIVEFYKYGAVVRHIPSSVLSDEKPNKKVSFAELKSLFEHSKISIDGIEDGNIKLLNLCLKAVTKCIDNLDVSAHKESVISELNEVKGNLEKHISEVSDLALKNTELSSTLEGTKAKSLEEETRLNTELSNLKALDTARQLIDKLHWDVMANKADKDGSKKVVNEYLEVPEGKEAKVIQVLPKQKIGVKEITIHWAEGSVDAYPFPKTYTSYKDANEDIKLVYNDWKEESVGYNKTKFTVVFEDGEVYEGRLDVCEKEDNPYASDNVIGIHIFDYLTYLASDKSQTSEETKKEVTEFIEKYDLGELKGSKGEAPLPRIEKMAKDWKETGVAVSKVGNDDEEFFRLIDEPTSSIGFADESEGTQFYYNLDKYPNFDTAIKHARV